MMTRNEAHASLAYARMNLGRLISLELSRDPDTPVRLHRLELLRDTHEALEMVERLLAHRRKERQARERRAY
jgi:hypothetical protein